MPRLLLALLFCLLIAPDSRSADPETAWKEVIALDAGPQRQPKSPQDAQAIIFGHLQRQERALRGFLAEYPESEHAFDAQLRLARLLTLRGEMQGASGIPREAQQILARLEKEATPAQRADLDFAKLTQQMRAHREPTSGQRQNLLTAARRFQATHPADRRIAGVLAEVATRFNSDPQTKQTLLLDALRARPDDDTKQRINDDLRGVALLGKPVPLPASPDFDLAALRGKVVVLIFFAVWSEPSLEAVTQIKALAPRLPEAQVQVVGVSLDPKRERLDAFVKAQGLDWPILSDGEGWESPAIRKLGINALPTVWILDPEGHLRSLDGLNNTVAQVREILRAR